MRVESDSGCARSSWPWHVWAGALAIVGALASPAAAQSAAEQGARVSWHERYQRARAALLDDRFAEAAREFRALEQSAPDPQDRSLASELASLASDRLARHAATDQPSLRTGDELTVLYTTAVFYGLGTSGWLALQLKPQSFGAAILPFAVITPAAVATVAFADSYRPLRHGIPHAIAAGVYLGFGEGLWMVGYQNAYAEHHPGSTRWSSDRVATALWITSTAGGGAGALIGALRRPTPGRISFTASTAIWGGLLSAFTSTALDSERDERRQRAYLVGAIGYNVGLVTGLMIGPTVAPSVARVRFTDLGGLFGALTGGGGYALLAAHRDSRVGFGATAIGSALGLGLAWWATSGMPPDHSHDQLPPAIGARDTGLASLRPSIAPTRGGFIASLGGEL